MTCQSCRGNSIRLCTSCNGPKKTEFCSDCMPWSETWIKKVDTVPDPFDADINHIYQTPDNKLYILSNDRLKMVEVGSGGGSIYDDSELKNRLATLETKTSELEAKPDNDTTYTAGANISIDGNVISAIVQSYDDTDVKNRIALLESELNNNTAYTAGDGIEISSDKVISAVERLPIFVESDTPTKIYSFRITPYASVRKKDLATETFVYNATINTPYQSGIMVAQDDLTREYQLSWQNLLTDYNVMSIMSVTFAERQILNKSSFIRLDSSNNISFAVQDFDEGINIVSVANVKYPKKTQNNKEVSCAISWMRVDVTYYKIEKGEL